MALQTLDGGIFLLHTITMITLVPWVRGWKGVAMSNPLDHLVVGPQVDELRWEDDGGSFERERERDLELDFELEQEYLSEVDFSDLRVAWDEGVWW